MTASIEVSRQIICPTPFKSIISGEPAWLYTFHPAYLNWFNNLNSTGVARIIHEESAESIEAQHLRKEISENDHRTYLVFDTEEDLLAWVLEWS